ncbi:MAG TPA: hypothetical protein VF185_01320 [Patescibacteria group bacterium]
MSKETVSTKEFLIKGMLATLESMAQLPFDTSNELDTQEVVVTQIFSPNTLLVPENQS